VLQQNTHLQTQPKVGSVFLDVNNDSQKRQVEKR